jgi:hypothetical protein
MDNEITKPVPIKNSKKLFFKTFSKYLTEALIITLVAYYIPIFLKYTLRKPTIQESLSIGLLSAIIMMVLDGVIVF